MASTPFFITSVVLVATALVVDLAIGDPPNWPHPVKLMGHVIAFLEAKWNRPVLPAWQKKWLGALLAFVIVAGFGGGAWGLLYLIGKISFMLALAVNLWLVATTIAWKGLVDAGKLVDRALAAEDLELARRQVGQIVGRDTETLDESEIIRATVETLAENLVDGIVAPIVFGLIGQAPLALAYRAINTLDSMVGYKHERWREFGFVSAKLDDIANWVPARITGLIMLIVLFVLHKDASGAWRVLRRDAKKHPSPNGGIPEALIAGGLGIRLGGWNRYHGIPSFRAYLGDPTRELRRSDIRQTIIVIHGVVSLIMFIAFAVFVSWIRR